MAEKTAEGKKQAAEAPEKAEAADQDFVAPPAMDKMIQAIASGQKPSALAEQGVTAQSWMAAATLKFEGYSEVENELIDRAVADLETYLQFAADADDAPLVRQRLASLRRHRSQP